MSDISRAAALDLLPARDVIADALCRSDAMMPSPATFARADRVLDYLAEAGWRLVPADGEREAGG